MVDKSFFSNNDLYCGVVGEFGLILIDNALGKIVFRLSKMPDSKTQNYQESNL